MYEVGIQDVINLRRSVVYLYKHHHLIPYDRSSVNKSSEAKMDEW